MCHVCPQTFKISPHTCSAPSISFLMSVILTSTTPERWDVPTVELSSRDYSKWKLKAIQRVGPTLMDLEFCHSCRAEGTHRPHVPLVLQELWLCRHQGPLRPPRPPSHPAGSLQGRGSLSSVSPPRALPCWESAGEKKAPVEKGKKVGLGVRARCHCRRPPTGWLSSSCLTALSPRLWSQRSRRSHQGQPKAQHCGLPFR